MSSFVLALLIVILVAAGIAWLFPEESERFLRGVLVVRRVVFGIGVIILGLFLLSTGAGGLMALGAVILALVVLYLIHDPDDTFGSALPWE